MWFLINYFTVHPCDTTRNGGCSQICKKVKDKYACACEDGFVIQKDGKTCVKGLIWYPFFLPNACIYNCRFIHRTEINFSN